MQGKKINIIKDLVTIFIAYLISGLGICLSILFNINLAEFIYGDLSSYDMKASLGYYVLGIILTGLLPAIFIAPIILFFWEELKLYLVITLSITQIGVYVIFSDNDANLDLANLVGISCLPTYFAFVISMYLQKKVHEKISLTKKSEV